MVKSALSKRAVLSVRIRGGVPINRHLMITSSELLAFAYHPIAYEQRLVNIVVPDGRQVLLLSPSELASHPLNPTNAPVTIKIEGMERYSNQLWEQAQELAFRYGHDGPITCHAFISPVNGATFGIHTDPDNVIIYCVEGTKTMEIEGDLYRLQPGEYVYIPYDTPHRAINEHFSVMLSFGLERYYNDKMSSEGR